jgi:hypothetical protein
MSRPSGDQWAKALSCEFLADAADGKISQFRLGLEQRGLAYLVQVPGTISAYPQEVAPETMPYGAVAARPCPAT